MTLILRKSKMNLMKKCLLKEFVEVLLCDETFFKDTAGIFDCFKEINTFISILLSV